MDVNVQMEDKALLGDAKHLQQLKEKLQRNRTKYDKFQVPFHDLQSLDFSPIDSQKFSYRTFLKWLVAFLIGVSVGMTVVGIRVLVELITDHKYEFIQDFIASTGDYFVPFVIWFGVNLALAISAATPVILFEPAAAGSGIPEVKGYLNGVHLPKTFNIRTLFTKIFSIICSYSSGLMLGPEGPLIHIGASIAAGISQGRSGTLARDCNLLREFRNDKDKRDFITMGAAAVKVHLFNTHLTTFLIGIGAAFGAPIGGVLWALEEACSFWSLDLTWRTFFCTLTSVFACNVIYSIKTGHMTNSYGLLTLDLDTVLSFSYSDLGPVAILGALAGLTGALFVRINYLVSSFRKKFVAVSRARRFFEIILLSAVTSTVRYWLALFGPCVPLPVPIIGNSSSDDSSPTDVLKNTFSQFWCPYGSISMEATCLFNTQDGALRALFNPSLADIWHVAGAAVAVETLVIFFLVSFLFVACTMGTHLAAGIFIPLMLIGATLGSIVGELSTLIFATTLKTTIFAVIGCAAMVTGVTRLTFSIAVIMVELTTDTSYLLPLIMAIYIAKWIADRLGEPVYEMLMTEVKGIPYLPEKTAWNVRAATVGTVMGSPVVTFRLVEDWDHIVQTLRRTQHNGFPVVDAKNRLIGFLLRRQILVILEALVNEEHNIGYLDMVSRLVENSPVLQRIEDSPGKYLGVVGKSFDFSAHMNRSPFSIHVDSSLTEAYRVFRLAGLRHLTVINEKGVVVGMVTRKDLI